MAEEQVNALGEDARFELALAAAAQERRNRPRHLTILAGLLLVAALVGLWVTVSGMVSARTALSGAKRQAVEVEAMVARLAQLRAADNEQGPGGEPTGGSNVRTTLLNMAGEAGLEGDLPPPQDSTKNAGTNLIRRDYSYNDVRSVTIGPLVRWITSAVEAVPGLEVSRVTLKTGPQGWTMNITYSRVEQLTGSTGG
jgi:hypothetical protein